MHFDNDGDVTEDDYGENDDEFDEYDPQQNLGAQSNPQLIGEIMSTKMANQPPMFISGWEEDEQGIEQKDMSDPIEQFLSAAEEGNLHLMELLLSERPDLLMARDRDNYTALHRAAYSDKSETCKWLLSKVLTRKQKQAKVGRRCIPLQIGEISK
ncbi:hypothetical protein niasHS_015965 [Heterodera schachtii]|uniref:Uncharacterized protein n=1 Tax=Heterodera schachtii TaxID=97005 RepID=A0ABD2HXJ0_HETSC